MTEKLSPKRILLNRINRSIIKANNGQRKQFGIVTKVCNRNSINRAVSIARNPGPHMDFEAGELNILLINAGFKPYKRKQ